MKRFLSIAATVLFAVMAFQFPTPLPAADETGGAVLEEADQDSDENSASPEAGPVEQELRHFVCPTCAYTGDKPGDCPGCRVPLVEDILDPGSASETAEVDAPGSSDSSAGGFVEEPSPLTDKGPEPETETEPEAGSERP